MPPKEKKVKGNSGRELKTKEKRPSREPLADAASDSDEEEEEEGGFRIGGVYIPPAPSAVCSSENAGPRLIISHIVNTNFKSYAGTQTLGPFHKSFTSIIGPNGSGKSNVIDSMLFVFGYRATKIRSKKISVLLHKSENHQNIRSATVEVHFVQINDLEGEEFEKIPGTEIVIARTAFHDNTSHYSINGKRAQFKDVAAILRKHGIDLVHNRFLILQGEVEQIAMMKPKALTEHETGMLEYLEDIIGTSRYRKPLKKLEVKLNVLNEERLEKINRAKVVEKERESLRGPMEEAVDCLQKENDHTTVWNKVLQLRLFRQQKKLGTLEQNKKTFDEAMANIEAQLNTFKKEQSEYEKGAQEKSKELERLKKQSDLLNEEFVKSEDSLTNLKENIKNANKKRKQSAEAITAEQRKAADLEKIPEKNEKDIAELKKIVEKLEIERTKEEKELEKVMAALKAETQELQGQKDVLMTELVGLNNTRDGAKAAYEVAKTEVDLYQNNEKSEKAKLEKLLATKERNEQRLKDQTALKTHIQEKLPDAERRLLDTSAELQSMKQQEESMTRELHSKRAALEEKKSSINAFRSRNKVLNFIMQKKAEGQIPGVFGRLGDLGGIAPRYDCAISTACGLLDYIVTDTVDTASKCLALLRQYDVGRGNFIALEKQEGLKHVYEKPFRAPENVPRLFDLIQVNDERLKPAFYFALRDTLVAEELIQARRVAYGATRYRVVTLEGEIIEIAGTMSGGGRDKRTGRMGASATVVTDSNPAEISAMEKRVTELQEKLSTLHDRIRAGEDTVSSLTTDTRKWRTEFNSAASEVQELLKERPTFVERIKVQEAAVAKAVPDPAVVYELTAKLENLQEEYDNAAAASSDIQKQVDKLTSQIKAITGGRMKEAQKKLEDATKKLDKVNAEITKLTVEIKTSQRNLKNSLTKIQNLNNDVTAAEKALRNYEEQLQKLKDGAAMKDQELKEFSEQMKTLEVELKEVRGKIATVSKEINKIKSNKIDDDKKLEDMVKQLADATNAISSLKNEISKLKLNQIPFQPPVADLPTFTAEELSHYSLEKLEYEGLTMHEGIKEMSPNVNAIKEFNEKDAVYKQRLEELEDANNRRNEVRTGFDNLRKSRLYEFMEGFNIISSKLKEMYQTITMGGDAEFDLLDTLDPFSEGVSFSVRPPKKSWKNISNLSGGEKTLSSLALVFALHYYKPSPLYVMDEIDAALDFRNVSIVGHYIKERTKNAQFIIISLRSNMFELADLLVGIYKTHNCTKSVTITPGKYLQDCPSS